LQRTLGHVFRDALLLRLALTHPSVAHETGVPVQHNQRLEFLGDAVLQLVLTRELYEKFPSAGEGPLTKARAQMVNRRTLADQFAPWENRSHATDPIPEQREKKVKQKDDARVVDEQIKRAGEEAMLDVGITDIHPELVKLLGRLQFRTSYGQNVLKHLVESAHIAASIASELGLDPAVPKRGAFLHDIGKAVTHEVEGSHAIIGAEIARRLRESPEVVHCIESHHGEVEQRTIEAVLAQIADGISGGRPGARRESLETYVKRLERLEEICTSYPGVEKTFAMQAGREVRVMVKPEEIDDLQAQVMARDIAKQVEEELQYPGQIKITVVRESRSIEYAR
jgi:ribonuclease Y